MASRSANLFELLRDAGEGDAPKKRKEDKKPESVAPAKPAAPKAAAKKAESPAVKSAPPKAAASKAKQDKPATAARPASDVKSTTGGAISAADKKPRADRPARAEGNNRPRGEGRPPREGREVREVREVREIREGEPRKERRDREKPQRSDVVREDKGFVQISKRVHERRPGTGRPGNENKKGGAGKANWGKPGSELDAAEPSEVSEQSEENAEVKPEETKEEPAQPKVLTPEEEEAIKEKEKEERMVTLEEFKKKAEEEKANLPLPQARKAGEGVNPDKWASYQKLEKNDEDSLFSVSQKGKGKAVTPASGTKKNVVPVTDVLNVKQERKPERGPRESRGGRVSRGGRGDFAGKRSGGNKTEFTLNEQAFPALKEGTTKA